MSIVEDIRDIYPEYNGVDDVVDDGYEPLEWAKGFHSGAEKYKFLSGGLGSGKSYATAQEFKTLAIEYPGSQWLVARWTLPDLKETALKVMLSVLPTRLIKCYHKTDKTVTLVNDSRFLFRGLKDDPDNPQKVKSYEYNGEWLEEATELPRMMFARSLDRARLKLNGRFRNCSVFSFNPPDETHWMYDVAIRNPLPDSKVYYSRTVDNMANLAPGYIEQLKAMYPAEQWPMVMEGRFGAIRTAEGVFSTDFNPAIHCKEMVANSNLVMRRCWDFGFVHPSCIVFQIMPNGQNRDLKEFFGSNVFTDDFGRQVVDQCHERWPGANWIDYGDPHGNDRHSSGNEKNKSDIDILRNLFGIVVHSRRSSIDEGIKVMRMKMKTIVGGEALWVIDPTGCPTLRAGLAGGYKIDPKTGVPKKDGYYEHVMDSRRYGFINTAQHELSSLHNLKKTYYNTNKALYSYGRR